MYGQGMSKRDASTMALYTSPGAVPLLLVSDGQVRLRPADPATA
jgi:hypothetical protein